MAEETTVGKLGLSSFKELTGGLFKEGFSGLKKSIDNFSLKGDMGLKTGLGQDSIIKLDEISTKTDEVKASNIEGNSLLKQLTNLFSREGDQTRQKLEDIEQPLDDMSDPVKEEKQSSLFESMKMSLASIGLSMEGVKSGFSGLTGTLGDLGETTKSGFLDLIGAQLGLAGLSKIIPWDAATIAKFGITRLLPIASILSGLYGGISTYFNEDKIRDVLGKDKDAKITTAEKFHASALNLLSGMTFGLLDAKTIKGFFDPISDFWGDWLFRLVNDPIDTLWKAWTEWTPIGMLQKFVINKSTDLFKFVGNFWGDVLFSVKEQVQTGIKNISMGFNNFITNTINFFKQKINFLTQEVPMQIGNFIGYIKDEGIGVFLTDLKNWFSSGLQSIHTGLSEFFPNLLKDGMDVIDNVSDTIMGFFNTIKDWFMGMFGEDTLFGKIVNFLTKEDEKFSKLNEKEKRLISHFRKGRKLEQQEELRDIEVERLQQFREEQAKKLAKREAEARKREKQQKMNQEGKVVVFNNETKDKAVIIDRSPYDRNSEAYNHQ